MGLLGDALKEGGFAEIEEGTPQATYSFQITAANAMEAAKTIQDFLALPDHEEYSFGRTWTTTDGRFHLSHVIKRGISCRQCGYCTTCKAVVK